ncbi:hypothetical protein JOB18_034386 [Solea senegalensis]|uniref:Uncharacterized protein n=1 Tax=Solea senegalensis TaxID=28829 RepID=A0AAV6SME7_SOLSE|nr:hypothetical protein JOB18_034386 [Solea senegalensis]
MQKSRETNHIIRLKPLALLEQSKEKPRFFPSQLRPNREEQKRWLKRKKPGKFFSQTGRVPTKLA